MRAFQAFSMPGYLLDPSGIGLIQDARDVFRFRGLKYVFDCLLMLPVCAKVHLIQ